MKRAARLIPFAIYLCSLGYVLFQSFLEVQQIRLDTGSLKYQLAALALALASGLAVLVVLVQAFLFNPDKLQKLLARRWVLWAFWAVVIGLSGLLLWGLTLTNYGNAIDGTYIRWLMFAGALAVIAFCTPRDEGGAFRWPLFFSGVILFGSLVSLGDAFRASLTYPFQLYWSEGNRFWDYSVLFGRRLYDYPANQPIPAYIDLGRQSLWGLPFLFFDLSIRGMRFWNAVVFTIPYIIFGWLVFWPKRGQWFPSLIMALWTFLFLSQGPIYTPLILCAALVALALRSPLLLAALLVFISSYYAQVSRFTWMFAPGIWAAVISLAQVCPPRVLNERQRWTRAITLGLSGLMGGLAAPRIFDWAAGLIWPAPVELGNESLTIETAGIIGALTRQPLLWDRLLPNSTFAMGILLALFLAAGPLLALVFMRLFGRHWRLNRWQKLAILGMVLAFMVVGLIVSVKIGGGSNLHNVDMLLIALVFLAGLIWESDNDFWEDTIKRPAFGALALLAMAVIYPITPIREIEPIGTAPGEVISDSLKEIRQAVAAAREEGGEVLFIDQRQLLTFGYVDVPLVPEYEKKRMMDEAMSNNAAYFEPFYRDIENQRFHVIISEPLRTHYQGDTRIFGNENDAWVYWVSRPLLCYYRPISTIRQVGVEILVPRDVPCPSVEETDFSTFK